MKDIELIACEVNLEIIPRVDTIFTKHYMGDVLNERTVWICGGGGVEGRKRVMDKVI